MSDRSSAVQYAVDMANQLDKAESATDMKAVAERLQECLQRDDYEKILKTISKVEQKGKGADIQVIDFNDDKSLDCILDMSRWGTKAIERK